MFNAALPHNHTETSKAAAEKMRPHAPRDRERILWALQENTEGLTRDEVAAFTGINPNTVRPRVLELIRKDLIHEQEMKRNGCLVLFAGAKS